MVAASQTFRHGVEFETARGGIWRICALIDFATKYCLAVEVNLYRHSHNTLRPHQALDERTPRAAYLAVEHCDWRVAFGGPAT